MPENLGEKFPILHLLYRAKVLRLDALQRKRPAFREIVYRIARENINNLPKPVRINLLSISKG